MHSKQVKQKGQDKTARARAGLAKIGVDIQHQPLPKPSWIRTRLPARPEKVQALKRLLREQKMVTVCEEASCPNLYECFNHGTATFMIMGDRCTRRCTFCDVAHGRPDPLDPDEPRRLAESIAHLNLQYVVITSVDRDDLLDGGANHFAQVIQEIRQRCPQTKIEVLVPDFRGRMTAALEAFAHHPPDVFNHNIETVPSLYAQARPGADYQWSLNLLKAFKDLHPNVPTKSGLMVGLGETIEELKVVFQEMRAHNIDRLTVGQYLQPSPHHHPVCAYITPETFDMLKTYANSIGFSHVASGPLVRSSYHADKQAAGESVA